MSKTDFSVEAKLFIRGVIILLLVCFAATAVSAVDGDPSWLLLEQGKSAYENRDLASATRYLLDAIESDEDYPEALYWLGRVYEAQGEPVLAEDLYREALEKHLYLRVPEDRVLMEYSLAALYRERGRHDEQEVLLQAIVDREGGSEPAVLVLEHDYIRRLTETGPDELVFLYRDELTFSLRARRELAELAARQDRYRAALLHRTRTALSLFSTMARVVREADPGWRFDIDPLRDPAEPDRDVRYPGLSDGCADLIDRALEIPELAAWIETEGIWATLYYWGEALAAEGFTGGPAESVWNLLAPTDDITGEPLPREETGRWGRLAAVRWKESR